MKPIDFNGANRVFGKQQQGVEPLPAYMNDEGQLITAWELTFYERLKLLFTGEIWVYIRTNNRGVYPMYLTTTQKDILIIDKTNKL